MVCTRCAIEKLLEEKGKTNKKAPVHEHTGPCGLVVEKALRRDGWGAGQPILQLKPHPHARQRLLSSTLASMALPKAGPPRPSHKAQGCPELRAQLGGPGYACGSGRRTGQRANGTAEFAGTVAGLHTRRSALGTVRNAWVGVDAR